MDAETIIALLAGVSGLLVAMGLPKYFEWKREKQTAKINELIKEIDLKKTHISELKLEIRLEREKRATAESNYHRIIDRLNTSLVYLDIMATRNDDLKEVIAGIKESINLTPAST
jgi:hypothetical protein